MNGPGPLFADSVRIGKKGLLSIPRAGLRYSICFLDFIRSNYLKCENGVMIRYGRRRNC